MELVHEDRLGVGAGRASCGRIRPGVRPIRHMTFCILIGPKSSSSTVVTSSKAFTWGSSRSSLGL